MNIGVVWWTFQLPEVLCDEGLDRGIVSLVKFVFLKLFVVQVLPKRLEGTGKEKKGETSSRILDPSEKTGRGLRPDSGRTLSGPTRYVALGRSFCGSGGGGVCRRFGVGPN